MTGLGDRSLGIGLLVLAVAYGWVAQQWPEPFGGAETVGPETFPTILAVVLAAGSIYLMIKPDPDAQWPLGKTALELVVSLVVLVVYALLLEPLGFVISTTLAVGTLSWRMGAPFRRAFVTGLVSAVVVFALFNYGLSLNLPAGLLEVN
ncbi:tripartite tricarboxylate transporter TctB family protein [Marinobacter sp. TBZ242]|uniref:Tripartite tricarboxylate transporter TctB family protein n=1 Tax=Marinobacter azerbaijanicus TaxID=3050455 RepID=A0ABT7I8Y6_9GAMM|nr:tripartite tricarboxylate transporter TctB family protein [Marinobacter sp. TBZ242]MDL0430607.1 tripartite tricarboxylate transporter TctB family protein [Marinobacter sp. TBZ242]